MFCPQQQHRSHAADAADAADAAGGVSGGAAAAPAHVASFALGKTRFRQGDAEIAAAVAAKDALLAFVTDKLERAV